MKIFGSVLVAATTSASSIPNQLVPNSMCPTRPGTCWDENKCCDWTWPPATTNKISCDGNVPDSGCKNCKAPDCCCDSGVMMLTPEGKIHVASCCDYFYPDGTMCTKWKDDGTLDCGDDVKLCKTFGDADCDKCGNRCIEFWDTTKAVDFLM